ncbi:hypothetical protein D3C84_997060 [compost metagenome]
MQQHVRIQFHLKKDPAVEQHHDQADGPAPGILFDRQPDGNDTEGGGKQFKPGHEVSLGKMKKRADCNRRSDLSDRISAPHG